LEIGNLQGIKQAGYNFHAWIDGWLKSKGMEPALADPCFYRRQVGTALLFLIIHVDDSRAASTSQALLDSFVAAFRSQFDTTMRDPVRFLGVEIQRTPDHLHFGMPFYVDKMLAVARCADITPSPLPAVPRGRLLKAFPEDWTADVRK
jgi:hypothetical protein